jgi:hypothetical protein
VLQGARRENILYRSSTDEQCSSSAKDRQPFGLFSGGRPAALLLSHRSMRTYSFVAPWQTPARKQRAPSLFMRWVPRYNFTGLPDEVQILDQIAKAKVRHAALFAAK